MTKKELKMQTKTFKVPNSSCGHCVRAIQNEVSELEGITSVEAAEDRKLVTVSWEEPPQTWDNIKASLIDIDYPPELSAP